MSESSENVSLETKIAVMGATLREFRDQQTEHMMRQDKTLERIEVQTIKTNGRVTHNEEDVREIQRAAAEQLEAMVRLARDQTENARSISKIRRMIWRVGIGFTSICLVLAGVVWALDHGVIEFTPANYHSANG